VETMIT